MAEAPETGSDEINVDELLSQIEAPAPERAMTGPEESPAAEATQEPPAWDGKAWEFDWNGKKVFPESQEKAKTWMSQGYNYAQRMGEFNKTQQAWAQEKQRQEQEYQSLVSKLSPYQKVDEYARQNPQWWQHVLQEFERQQQAGQGVDPKLAQLVKPLEEKLSKFEQYFGQLEQQQLAADNQKDDQTLDQEIEAIRKEFPNIDLNAVDPETGKSLELRVLEVASEMFGHLPKYKEGTFKAAFWKHLGPKLIEEAKASGRQAVATNAQANAKKGILGKTPAPVKSVIQPTSVRGKSYDQLTKEALAELGIA